MMIHDRSWDGGTGIPFVAFGTFFFILLLDLDAGLVCDLFKWVEQMFLTLTISPVDTRSGMGREVGIKRIYSAFVEIEHEHEQ